MRKHIELIGLFKEIWWLRETVWQTTNVAYIIKVATIWLDSRIQESSIWFWSCQENSRVKQNRQFQIKEYGINSKWIQRRKQQVER